MRRRGLALVGLIGIVFTTQGLQAQSVGQEQQIKGALSAAPEDRREGATVMGYNADGELVSLREGTNELICLADQPGDDKFRVACYHKSLEPYMVRGRELRAEGIDGADNR